MQPRYLLVALEITMKQFTAVLMTLALVACQGAVVPNAPPSLATTSTKVSSSIGETGRITVTPGGIPITFGLRGLSKDELDHMTPWSIWTTAYIVRGAPEFSGLGAVSLLSESGRSLGVSVSHADYCHGAVEGTLSVTLSNGSTRAFNYATAGTRQLADCADIFKKASKNNPARVRTWGRTLFAPLPPAAPFGTGGHSQGRPGTCDRQLLPFRLVPHRSLAVDYKVRAAGVAIYVPALRGTRITFADGTEVTHDGYVLAADSGGSIHGNHVDYFLGPAASDTNLSSISADKNHPILAYVVTDPEVIRVLCEPHIQPGQSDGTMPTTQHP